MESAMAVPPCACAQRWQSRISDMLSAPPDTATARRGLDSNGPSPAISRANSRAASGLAAAVAMLFLLQALFQIVGRPGEFLVELAEGDTGIALLAALAQRHAELQQVVRRL